MNAWAKNIDSLEKKSDFTKSHYTKLFGDTTGILNKSVMKALGIYAMKEKMKNKKVSDYFRRCMEYMNFIREVSPQNEKEFMDVKNFLTRVANWEDVEPSSSEVNCKSVAYAAFGHWLKLGDEFYFSMLSEERLANIKINTSSKIWIESYINAWKKISVSFGTCHDVLSKKDKEWSTKK